MRKKIRIDEGLLRERTDNGWFGPVGEVALGLNEAKPPMVGGRIS
jgi:hypothetical protein